MLCQKNCMPAPFSIRNQKADRTAISSECSIQYFYGSMYVFHRLYHLPALSVFLISFHIAGVLPVKQFYSIFFAAYLSVHGQNAKHFRHVVHLLTSSSSSLEVLISHVLPVKAPGEQISRQILQSPHSEMAADRIVCF